MSNLNEFNFYSAKVQNETWRTAQTFFRHGGCTIEQKLNFSYYKIPVATYVLVVNYLSQIVLKYMQNSRKIHLRMCKRRNNIKQTPRGVKSVFEWDCERTFFNICVTKRANFPPLARAGIQAIKRMILLATLKGR